jgi:signal transduction histidine kinase
MQKELMEVLRDRARLAALKRTALMDTQTDPAFDRLSRLAAKLLRVPVALVSLVDDERQFFKSCVGLPQPYATTRQTDLEHSFCKHVVQTGQPLVISDARQDPLVKDNLAIRDIGVVAYLGIPIVSGEGQVLGSFCAIDSVPKVWSPDDIETLKQLTASVISEIELHMEVAERRLIESDLRKTQEQLEARVAERTREIQQLNDDLEERVKERTAQLVALNADLEAFAYTASHDLKTPLRAITGFGDILMQDHADELKPEARRHLDTIVTSAARMNQLIDDLLAYARLGQRAVRPQLLNLREELAHITDGFSSKLAEAGGRVVLPDSMPTVTSDRTLLSQVFTNILDNAIKYRKAGVPLEVNIQVREEPEAIVVAIRDNGIGIEPNYRNKVFDIFKRLHSDGDYSGTGIGLAIVRKAMMLLGGHVWVEGDDNGSTFYVRLPKTA